LLSAAAEQVLGNTTPTVNAGAATGTVTEASAFTRSGSFTDGDAGDSWTATVDYGDGSGKQPLTLDGQDFKLSHVYADDGGYTVLVAVTDSSDGIGTDEVFVTVQNVSPMIALSGPASIDEGSTYVLTLGAITDPGDDTVLQYVVFWGDGTANTYTNASGGKTHFYDDDALVTNPITVTVLDEDGAHANAGSLNRSVDNVAPTALVINGGAVSEGSGGLVVTVAQWDASANDRARGYTYGYDFNNDGDFLDAGEIASTVSANVTVPGMYLNDNPSASVRVEIRDKDGGANSYTTTIPVMNVDPTIDSLSGDMEIGRGQQATFTASAGDAAGEADPLTYTWDFGDGGDPLSGVDLTDVDHAYSQLGPYMVTLTVTDGDGGQDEATWEITVVRPAGSIAERYIFYNNSALDGNDPAANTADDGAIASDKTALLPGRTTAFANYTSYGRGINGVMVDIDSPRRTPTIGDFDFKVNTAIPNIWITAPAPVGITVRLGEGVGQSDRVTIIWADNAIENLWVKVTVKANANTDLPYDDVFCFGNVIGDTGGDRHVGSDDYDTLLSRFGQAGGGPAADFNCDGGVDFTDFAIQRARYGSSVPTPVFPSPPSPTIALSGPASVDEGSIYTLTLGEVTYPGEPHTVFDCIVFWGDGTANTYTNASGGKIHLYDDDALVTDPITVTLVDDEGAHANAGSLNRSVDNVAPTALVINGGAVSEGSNGIVVTVAQWDPSANDRARGYTYGYDFNNDGDFLDAGEIASTVSANVSVPGMYLNDAPSGTVRVEIRDKDGGTTSYTTTIPVMNGSPTIDSPLGDTEIGSGGDFGAGFSIPAFRDDLLTDLLTESPVAVLL